MNMAYWFSIGLGILAAGWMLYSTKIESEKGRSNTFLLALYATWIFGSAYVAGSMAGERKMFETIDSAMVTVLPASAYRRVMADLARRDEMRNAIGERDADASGGRYQ